jgi:hypothetical protein
MKEIKNAVETYSVNNVENNPYTYLTELILLDGTKIYLDKKTSTIYIVIQNTGIQILPDGTYSLQTYLSIEVQSGCLKNFILD